MKMGIEHKFLKRVGSPSISYGLHFIWFQDRPGTLYTIDKDNIRFLEAGERKVLKIDDCVVVDIPKKIILMFSNELQDYYVLDYMNITKNVGPKV